MPSLTLLAVADGDIEAAAAVIGFVVAIIMGLLIALAISAVVCWLLYGCFNRIPAQHRQMPPVQVWLMMIPVFNLVWAFFVYLRLSDSFKSYFAAQGRTDVGDCGRTIGLACAGVAVASIIPIIGMLAGPAALVLLIIYLVKVMGLKNQIPATAAAATM